MANGTNNTMSISSVLPWIIAAIALVILPFVFTGGGSITIMNQIGITIVLAMSYNMLLGQGGMLSFGHAVYMGLGGFVAVHVMNILKTYITIHGVIFGHFLFHKSGQYCRICC